MKSNYPTKLTRSGRHDNRERYSINFDDASKQAVNDLRAAVAIAAGLSAEPSVSLIVQCVVREYVSLLPSNPAALESLSAELRRRGGRFEKYTQKS